jgi:hypothetical protein
VSGLGRHVAVQPLRHGYLIPLGGLLGVPRLLQRNRLAHLSEFAERGAEIDPRTVVTDLGERAAADPVAGLQNGHRVARLLEPQRRRQPRESRPDHTEVDVSFNRHGPLPAARALDFVTFSQAALLADNPGN